MVMSMRYGMIKLLVLKLLHGGDRTGYELMKDIESLTGHRPSSGTIYPMLKGMKEEGLIEGREEGGRTYYSLTPVGSEKLKELHRLRIEFLHRVMDTISAAGWEEECDSDGDLNAFSYIVPFMAAVKRAKERGVSEERIREIVREAADRVDELKGEM